MISIRTHSGEVIEVEPDGPLNADDLQHLLGEAPDPMVAALVREIRRLSDRIAVLSEQRPEAPVVNVSPTPVNISTPEVRVSPSVNLETPRRWVVNVTEHFATGPLQGKIKQVEFIAL